VRKVSYLFIHLILGINIKDTQCGFKLYKTELAQAIFADLKELRFAFDLEIIYKLNKKNYNIILLPVRCYDVQGSKVNLIKDSINMFFALFRIKRG
jgi:dolichyl-phosphate beta-glucosyltransferase